MSKQYNAELQAKVEKFLKDNSLSQAKAAPILGLSQAVLSGYRNSNYAKGDIAAVEKKLEEFFRIHAMLPKADWITTLELMLREAEGNKASYTGKADPKVIELRRADEKPLFEKVVGGADLDIMNKNAAKRQGGKDHE